jgi:hypothetical protein
MAVDRFGNGICIGWPEHHILYLKAVLTLPRDQHTAAFQDIADMTGRSLNAVRTKAYAMWQEAIDARWAETCRSRKELHEANRARRKVRRVELAAIGPSRLAQPTAAQMMGSR